MLEIKQTTVSIKEHEEMEAIDLLPLHFSSNSAAVTFENNLYLLADKYLILDGTKYQGGSWIWHTFKAHDECAVMILVPKCQRASFDTNLMANQGFDYDKPQTPMFVAIILSMRLFEMLSNHYCSKNSALCDFYADQYYALRNYAGELLNDEQNQDFFYLYD